MEKFFKHNKAEVETGDVGEGTRIWAFSYILSGARIGRNCNICSHTFIEGNVSIGDNVTIKSGVYIWDGLKIENNAFIGPNVTFTNDLFPRSKRFLEEYLETTICEGASIGANATIVAGTTIGKYSLIGAGSVVTKNIPQNTLWYGNPAVFQGYICDCGSKLDKDLNCQECEQQYILVNEEIIKKIKS